GSFFLPSSRLSAALAQLAPCSVVDFARSTVRRRFPIGELRPINRMHGQNPLRFPGAWHAYRYAAWTVARCPHKHNSREGSASRRGLPRAALGSSLSAFISLTATSRFSYAERTTSSRRSFRFHLEFPLALRGTIISTIRQPFQ